MNDNADQLNKMLEGMQGIRDRKAAELKKLMEDPELYDVAQAVADAQLDNLNYLCNFSHCVDEFGNKHPINDVHDQLKLYVEEVFTKMTGRTYQPTAWRDSRFMKAKRARAAVLPRPSLPVLKDEDIARDLADPTPHIVTYGRYEHQNPRLADCIAHICDGVSEGNDELLAKYMTVVTAIARLIEIACEREKREGVR